MNDNSSIFGLSVLSSAVEHTDIGIDLALQQVFIDRRYILYEPHHATVELCAVLNYLVLTRLRDCGYAGTRPQSVRTSM